MHKKIGHERMQYCQKQTKINVRIKCSLICTINSFKNCFYLKNSPEIALFLSKP